MENKNLDKDRRSFLKATAVTSASAFAGVMIQPKNAYANDWGAVDSSLYNRAPVKVLEINLVGAPSFWETLWVRKKADNSPDYLGLDDLMANVIFNCPNGGGNNQDTPVWNELSPTALATGNSESTFLGPAAKPIWHLIDRMRMVTMRHKDNPIEIHEVALPYGLTGTNPGNGRHTGPGVAIARRARILKQSQLTPHAYVINTGFNNLSRYFNAAGMAMGMHNGINRPLFLRMETVDLLTNRLDRVNTTPGRDDLLRALNSQYRDQLLFHADPGQLVRSANHVEYEAALNSLFNATNLKNLLPNSTTVTDSPYCVANEDGSPAGDQQDPVKAAIQLAASLLTHPTDSASHVLVGDIGLRNLAGNQPSYDTHGSLIASEFEGVQSPLSNLYSLFTALNDVIDPSGQDPNKINLDDTMIVLSTEFGRRSTPQVRDGRRGREHNAFGYLNVMIGGPIDGVNSGSAGWLKATNNGEPLDDWYTPADFRAAVLLAAGVDPFSPEIFGTTDAGDSIFAAGGTEESNIVAIANQILGV